MLIVIAQINMLVCLLSDIMDYKLIQVGLFKPKKEMFDPNTSF